MTTEPTTFPRDWCQRLSAGVEALGIGFEEHLTSIGLPPDLDAFRRREAILLLAANAALTADEGLGLLSLPTPPGSFALRVGTMMTCQTLGAALTVCHSFTRVSRLPIRIHFGHQGPEASISISVEGADADAVATAEDMFASAVFGVLTWLVGRDLPLIRVTTRLAGSPFLGQRHPILRAEVLAGDVTRLVFPAPCLDWPIVSRNTMTPIWDASQWFGREVLSANQPLRQVRAPKTAHTGEAAPTGESDLDLTTRTRLAHMRDLVATTDLSFSEIARRLGFSGTRNLRRFVRIHTGCTPTVLRQQSRQIPTLPLSDLAGRVQLALRSLDLASLQSAGPP